MSDRAVVGVCTMIAFTALVVAIAFLLDTPSRWTVFDGAAAAIIFRPTMPKKKEEEVR